jgi:hypothetical protein
MSFFKSASVTLRRIFPYSLPGSIDFSLVLCVGGVVQGVFAIGASVGGMVIGCPSLPFGSACEPLILRNMKISVVSPKSRPKG